jgi:hypothetical protein
MRVKAKENSKKIASVLNFPTFSFVYKIVVVKNILVTVTVKFTSNSRFNVLSMQLKRLYDIQLHYTFLTSINYACVKMKPCTKLPISSV